MNKYCKVCGYDVDQTANVCPVCGQDRFYPISNMSFDDLLFLSKISSDDTFLQAMIDLKEQDIIEYQLKMSQFRAQVAQQQQQESNPKDNVPKCPTCGSTNIQRIGTGEKVVSGALWGLFSNKVHKTYKCNNCKHMW